MHHGPSLFRLSLLSCASVVLVLAACAPDGGPARKEDASPPPAETADSAVDVPAADDLFVDVASESGLVFVHWNGMTGTYDYPEMMGSGVALLDFDNDGDLDVYLVQGNLLGAGEAKDAVFDPPGPLPLRDRLYKNDLGADGRLRFTDVTEESGLDARGYGMGVAAADFDNDGWTDLYVTNLEENQLWRNVGQGRPAFRDVTAEAGVGEARWSVPAAVADFDRDGWLDLFVGNYVVWDAAAPVRCSDELGMANYCGPLAFAPQPNTLYMNRGGVFEDVSGRAGIRVDPGGTLGAAAADFDDDGWPDVYVANDGLPNHLWINHGDETFEDMAILAGAAVNSEGHAEASMGVSVADYDNDGDEDVFIAHLERETNTVYVNDGQGFFEDRSVETGLGAPSWSFTGFGTAWFDHDNDGWLDLLVVNGAVKVIKDLALRGDPLPLHQKNLLFKNRGDGTYEDVSATAGAVFALSEVSRGAAFGDLDNDGDVDVVLSNNSGPVRLLENRLEKRPASDHRWLGLRLVVPAGDGVRDAWGARAGVLLADGRELYRRVGGAASYASSSDPRLHFGLGQEDAVERLRVRWPDGREEEWDDVAVDRYTTLVQGGGRAVSGGGP